MNISAAVAKFPEQIGPLKENFTKLVISGNVLRKLLENC